MMTGSVRVGARYGRARRETGDEEHVLVQFGEQVLQFHVDRVKRAPIQPKYDAQAKLSFWYVLPTEALRTLVYNHLRRAYPELNYCVEWKDTRGYGLHMTVSRSSWSRTYR